MTAKDNSSPSVDLTDSIHAPINTIQCRKGADSQCEDYYDPIRCKKCSLSGNYWRSDNWNCIAPTTVAL